MPIRIQITETKGMEALRPPRYFYDCNGWVFFTEISNASLEDITITIKEKKVFKY